MLVDTVDEHATGVTWSQWNILKKCNHLQKLWCACQLPWTVESNVASAAEAREDCWNKKADTLIIGSNSYAFRLQWEHLFI